MQSLRVAELGCHLVGIAKSDILACLGQNISQIDSLFVGDILGKKSDIADGSLRDWDFRKFNNLVGDYWIAPTFLDNMGVRSDHAQLCIVSSPIPRQHHVAHVKSHKTASIYPKAVLDGLVMPMCSAYVY